MSDVRPFKALRRENGEQVRDPWEAYYLLELEKGGKRRTGFVGVTAVSDFENDLLKDPDQGGNAAAACVSRPKPKQYQGLPVILKHHRSFLLEQYVPDIKICNPIYDFTNNSGIHTKVWRVDFPKFTERITDCFRGVENTRITDGRSLAEAAVRYAGDKRKTIEFVKEDPDEPLTAESWRKHTDVKRDRNGNRVESEYVLSLLFPDTEPCPAEDLMKETGLNSLEEDLLIHEL